MAVSITHSFTSLKGDGGDATLVRPSNWNAAHKTSMASGNLLGRLTAGPGDFEEIPVSALVAAALNTTTGAAFLAALGIGGFETGDVKFSLNSTAGPGWITYNGSANSTIGNATSGAVVRANADTQALWELIYNNVTDANCPVSGGRTGNSTNDFNAGKTLTLPRFSGRAIIGAGTDSLLTARVLGTYGGEEDHLLSIGEMPVHSHPNVLNESGHSHGIAMGSGTGSIGSYPAAPGANRSGTGNSDNATTGITITNANAGGGGRHNNMMPYVTAWIKVKL